MQGCTCLAIDSQFLCNHRYRSALLAEHPLDLLTALSFSHETPSGSPGLDNDHRLWIRLLYIHRSTLLCSGDELFSAPMTGNY